MTGTHDSWYPHLQPATSCYKERRLKLVIMPRSNRHVSGSTPALPAALSGLKTQRHNHGMHGKMMQHFQRGVQSSTDVCTSIASCTMWFEETKAKPRHAWQDDVVCPTVGFNQALMSARAGDQSHYWQCKCKSTSHCKCMATPRTKERAQRPGRRA